MKQGTFSVSLGFIIFLILIIVISSSVLFVIHVVKIGPARDDACKEVGYNEYDGYDKKCLGEDNYIEVYMACDDSLLNPKCRVLKEFINQKNHIK